MIARGEDFYVTGGSLRRDASSYVVRRADQELYDSLMREEYCYVLTSRQMGKSSLMIRAAVRLKEAGVRVVVLDLTAIGQNLTPEQWYDGLLLRLAQQLDLEDELETFWMQGERYGPMQRFMAALREVVLAEGKEKPNPSSSSASAPVGPDIVIFIDEIDTVRSLPFSTDEFFAAIRECYNRRAQDAQFERLTFCLLGVASPTDLIRNTQMTPFNIGRRIELNDFTLEEAASLAEGLVPRTQEAEPRRASGNQQKEAGGNAEREPSSRALVDPALGRVLLSRVLYWTGGHPYLTQRLCQALAEAGTGSEPLHSTDVDRVCAALFFSSQALDRDDNLIFVRERLVRNEEERAALLDLYRQILSGKRVRNDETHSLVALLRLSGIVRASEGFLTVRNRIYDRVFDRAWIRENMPDAELRRQRRAFRQGVLRALTVSALLLFLLIGIVLSTRHQNHLRIRHGLPDGTTLTLEDVTYGKKHHYEPGAFRLQDLLGGNQHAMETETDCLYAWTMHQDSRTLKPITALMEVISRDEHGCCFVSEQNNGYALYYGAEGYLFRSFPRRSKTVSLTFLDISGKPVTEFTIANPAPTLYPLWTAEPFPITKQAGDLSVTLNGLHAKANPFAKAVNDVSLVPEFQFRQNGRLTDAWEPGGVLPLSDATGNVSRVASGTNDPCNLCLYEPAWRLEGQFFRKKTASFPSAETWTVKNVPVPGPGQVSGVSQQSVQNGVTLEIKSIAGPGHFSYTDRGIRKALGKWNPIQDGAQGFGISNSQNSTFAAGGLQNTSRSVDTVSSSSPTLAIDVDKWDKMDDRRLTLWATDKSGRRFNVNSSGQNSIHGYYGLAIPPGVKTVDLHLVVQSARAASFLIKPPLPPARAAH